MGGGDRWLVAASRAWYSDGPVGRSRVWHGGRMCEREKRRVGKTVLRLHFVSLCSECTLLSIFHSTYRAPSIIQYLRIFQTFNLHFNISFNLPFSIYFNISIYLSIFYEGTRVKVPRSDDTLIHKPANHAGSNQSFPNSTVLFLSHDGYV